jgi:hypothetical protein
MWINDVLGAIDEALEKTEESGSSRERSLVKTKLQEAAMWAHEAHKVDTEGREDRQD